MTGREIGMAALALVGSPFRFNGRDPATGLDCLGLVGATLGRSDDLPARTSLRRKGLGDADTLAERLGLVGVQGPVAIGDIVLVQCSPVQPHLLVSCGADRFAHAHAGLGRVVIGLLDPHWTVARRWRLSCP